jgi:hypothetical protein
MRIEAGAYRGKPTYFNLIAPWQRPAMDQEFQLGKVELFTAGFVVLILFSALLGAVLLARVNLKKGRGDRRGAARLSATVFAVAILAWILGGAHHPSFDEIGFFFVNILSQTLLLTGMVWLLYVALEPYIRRRWPETIISWSRVLGGSLRDPLVGKDLLAGVLFGAGFTMLFKLEHLARLYAGAPPAIDSMYPWLGTRQFIASGLFSNLNGSIFLALFFFFLMFLLRLLLRRRWLTAVVFTLIFTLVEIAGAPLILLPLVILSYLVVSIACFRFGLLTMAALLFVTSLPISNFSSWYTSYMIAAHVVVLALAGWAFHISLGGEKLFKGNLLGE